MVEDQRANAGAVAHTIYTIVSFVKDEIAMISKSKRERVIVYVDGFNLYFGLRAMGWKKYYWLNIQAFALSLLIPTQELTHTKYFTSKITKPESKRKRQSAYLSALATLSDFSIYYGRYQSFDEKCHHCGHTYRTSNEKKDRCEYRYTSSC